MAFTFTKEERLCNKAVIAKLFDKGNRGFTQFPFRFIWVEAGISQKFPIQVLFAVSKRSFAKASSRNRIKRQMRELYRLQKSGLYSILRQKGRDFALMISYAGRELISYEEMDKHFRSGITRLKKEFEKDSPVSVPRPDQAV